MGIGAGCLSLKRFFLAQQMNDMEFIQISTKLRKNFISPIGFDDIREEAQGWCHPFTGEPTVEDWNQLIYDDILLFGMRTDTKKIPGTLFRLQMKKALEALQEKSDSSRVSKKAKESIKDQIRQELLKMSLPSIRLLECAWNLSTGEIWVTTSSKGVVGAFEKLFLETFAVSLVPFVPGTGIFFDVENRVTSPVKNIFDLAPLSFVEGK